MGKRRITSSSFCIPKIRSSNGARKTNRFVSPMSLLDRFREAVFRLIMLSDLSKATNESRASQTGAHHRASWYYYYPHDEPHHSEAVADCIEFIKKSSTADDDGDGGGDVIGATADRVIDSCNEVVIPLPVM